MSDCQAHACSRPTVNGTTCEWHSDRCFVAGCEELYDWGSGGLCAGHLVAAVRALALLPDVREYMKFNLPLDVGGVFDEEVKIERRALLERIGSVLEVKP